MGRKNRKKVAQDVNKENDFQILARIKSAVPADYKELKSQQDIVTALEASIGLQLYNMKMIDEYNLHNLTVVGENNNG